MMQTIAVCSMIVASLILILAYFLPSNKDYALIDRARIAAKCGIDYNDVMGTTVMHKIAVCIDRLEAKTNCGGSK